MTAICAKCAHMSLNGMGKRHWLWTCMAAARPQKMNYQTGEMVADPAYYYCADINKDGKCEGFEEGPNSINPQQTEEENGKEQ